MKTGRINSGRKALPPEQKKKLIALYVDQETIDKFKNADQLKQYLYFKITERLENIEKKAEF
jgi:hypothetical protein